MTCEGTVPHLRTPVLNESVLKQHYASSRVPITVYPEIISGDPLAAGGVVVRWLLNRPGHVGGDTSFPENNLVFAYDQNYLPDGMKAELLHIPTIDLAIFNNDDNTYDNTRDIVCYYAHKYLYNGGKLTEHVKSAVSLCKDQKLTHTEIAAILRRSKLFYVYESTAMISESLLCGCPVSVIETDYWRQTVPNYSYIKNTGLVMADSSESLELAKANLHHYRTYYENAVLKNAWNQLDHFVGLTQTTARSYMRK